MQEKDIFTPENILKVIDYFNLHFGASAKVNGSHTCSCKKTIPDGKFIYDIEGYMPGSDLINLGSDPFEFPLRYLHSIIHFHKNEEYSGAGGFIDKLHFFRKVSELFYISKDWQIYDIPEHTLETYINVMKISRLVDEAHDETNFWCDALHTSISEEDIKSNPDLKELAEEEKRIFSKPNEIISSIKKDIEYLVIEITKNRKLPPSYQYFKNNIFDPQELLNFQLSFIKDTYNTFKAKDILFPTKIRTNAIKTIESYFAELKNH